MSDQKPITLAEVAELTAEVCVAGGGHGPIAESVNTRLITEFRASSGAIAGELGDAVPLLLLTVKGAKTGLERIIPLAYFEIDARIVVIASMGGSDNHPTWYKNLIRNPDVKVEIGGGQFRARAVATSGPDREKLFGRVCELYSVFAGYQAKTSRVIPVVELKRIA
ncbi:MAG: deazaflavin-dependent oxidoreductase (nitroreductase family) [Gammaproteobacteria bacterium]|jgi:deazaflavin-dependent oxidoreductase (nitroreductase family)